MSKNVSKAKFRVKTDPDPEEDPAPSANTSGWDLLTTVKMNDLYMVSKLRCSTTGMDLIHTRVPGPHVQCYWVIPHTLDSDLGIPHILQHMLYQGGSSEYPHPGLLQKIANRSFSSGLKSWACRDHSCYYMTVAGQQGFAQLLPVAFNHIFSPQLQEATFLQEVYRMDGNGQDGGVCLEEIVELAKDPDEVASLELIRKVFGEESTYRFPPYGSAEALRSTNIQMVGKVKEFHEKYYHLANCCLVICGDISREDVCNLLGSFTSKYRSGGSWTKPWTELELSIPEPLPEISEVRYPSLNGNESEAEVVKIGIMGPPSTSKLNRCVAMRLALEYLVTGPLYEALMQFRESIITAYSTPGGTPTNIPSMSVGELEMRQTLFTIEIRNLPQQMVNSLPDLFRRTMEEQVNDPAAFNYARMVQVVNRFHHSDLANLENQVAEKICHSVIPDFIYATEDSDLMFDRRINSAYTIHHFSNQQPDFWKYVIQACLLDAKWVTIAAVPSRSLVAKHDENDIRALEHRLHEDNIHDTKRIAQRSRAALKLKKKQEDVDHSDTLGGFPLPAVSSIGFTKVTRYDNPRWASDTLCNFYFDDISSSYVFLTVIMDTSELTLEEKKYLVLFSQGILHSPYLDEGDVLRSAEELREQLNRDCLQFDTFFGLEWLGNSEDKTSFCCGNFPHLFCLRLQLDVSKVKEGFKLCQHVLWNTKWQAEKLKGICARLVMEVDLELKMLGPVMTRAMLTDSLYTLNCVPNCAGLIRQKMFLRKLGDELPKSMRRVSKMMEGIRMTLLRPENCTVHVAGSLSRMEFNLTEDPNARDAVRELFRATFDYTGWHWGYDTKRLSNAPDSNWMRTPECIARCSREQILRMEDATVGYLVQASPGIRSWQDSDYPLILLSLEYFIQEGGPLQKQLVDADLAQSVDIRVSPSEGLLYFEMRNCPNLAKSYGAAFDVIAKHCKSSGKTEADLQSEDKTWDELLLTSAKSSIIFRLTQEEDTPHHVAMLSLLAYYRNIQQLDKASRTLMERIAAATLEDVQNVTEKYLKPLFLQPCTCAASAPSHMAIPIIKELMERCGKRLALIPPVEHSSLASFNQ